MKKTGATLIWASTTAVPEGEPGRIKGDEVRYNAVAAKIMEEHGVTINDLHKVYMLALVQKPDRAIDGTERGPLTCSAM